MSMKRLKTASSLQAMRHYLLARPPAAEHALPVAEPTQASGTSPERMSKTKVIVIKIVALTAISLTLIFAQGWAAPRYYQPDYVAGFHAGLLEGALMPAALPGLLGGHDVPIYAPNNLGRSYKIGYILGLNGCGTFFFGVAFWQPRRRK